MDIDEQLELLDDLLHDLGKYIALPINMLPKGAHVEEFRLALEAALKRTRNGPTGAQSARQLWAEFVADSGNAYEARRGWSRLQSAVDAALAWEHKLSTGVDTLNRAQAQRDLNDVATAIRELMSEIRE